MRTRTTTEHDQQREQEQKRLKVEAEASRRENERLELERLRRGGETHRMSQAARYTAMVRGLSAGRWMPASELAASTGTAMDRGHALRTAEVAAKQAVADALAPLIEQAEAELEAATAERDEIARKGRLT